MDSFGRQCQRVHICGCANEHPNPNAEGFHTIQPTQKVPGPRSTLIGKKLKVNCLRSLRNVLSHCAGVAAALFALFVAIALHVFFFALCDLKGPNHPNQVNIFK